MTLRTRALALGGHAVCAQGQLLALFARGEVLPSPQYRVPAFEDMDAAMHASGRIEYCVSAGRPQCITAFVLTSENAIGVLCVAVS